VHEVSRRVWGLRLRRTERELALSSPFMLPSAHYKDVGVRVASFRSSIAHPTYSPVYASLCTSRYPTQNSGPSGSLLLTRKNFAFSGWVEDWRDAQEILRARFQSPPHQTHRADFQQWAYLRAS
jgi:hypothetical protein